MLLAGRNDFGPNQVAAIGLIAVVLGGIVSLGANVSTLRQTMAAMRTTEPKFLGASVNFLLSEAKQKCCGQVPKADVCR